MSPHKESRRILIVEDEPEIVAVYLDILKRAKKAGAAADAAAGGLKSSRTKPASNVIPATAQPTVEGLDDFEVTATTSGEEALSAVKSALTDGHPFALGFFDVLLGQGIDGIETVRRIHEMDENMYAVLVTAYQDRHVDSIQSIFGQYFQDRWDYLNKPFTEGEILQKARNMVSMWNIRARELEQRARLDELRRRLNDNEKFLTVAAVARSVGHEFGNILLQIMGRADLSHGGNEAEMRKALGTILTATEHAAKVLDRFKSLAKPQQAHEKAKMYLKDPVHETLALMDHEIQRRRIKTSVSLDNLPAICGNRTALVQVFMNLIINAMHAVKENGKIDITGSFNGEEIELRIRDSGPGIPEDLFDTIFEPFFTTKGDQGTGLGLPICKEIIEITHDGKLTVRNHPQGGAEFLLVFPVTSGDES